MMIEECLLTVFLMIASDAELIFDKSVPKISGDLQIAQRPKWVRSSAVVRPPLPTSYRNLILDSKDWR